jgi:hypothetical protein
LLYNTNIIAFSFVDHLRMEARRGGGHGIASETTIEDMDMKIDMSRRGVITS